MAILSQYLASLRAVSAATVRCYQHGAAGPWQVMTLIAGSKRRILLIAVDDDEMFMARSFNVTPKTTKQHLFIRSDKSVAYLSNYKRLRSTFCTIKAYNCDIREALSRLFATAELLVFFSNCCFVSATR